ncbi:hypothetical protein PMAYCL1PPCAC_17812, partial [Pristionchus mayeri]
LSLTTRRLLVSMLFTFLFFFPFVSSLNILHYSSTVASSHLSYANQLTSFLVDNGHNVDFIQVRANALVKSTPNRARKSVAVEFPDNISPWNTNADHLHGPFEDFSTWNPFKDTVFNKYMSVKDQLCPLVLDSPEVNALLSSSQFDIALVSAFDFCPLGLLHKYGIPVTMYSPCPLFYFQVVHTGSPELPIYENAVIDSRVTVVRTRFIDRLFDWTRSAYSRWQHEKNIDTATALFRSRYGSSFPDARELGRRVSFDFVNTIPLLDEPRPTTPRIKYIGGIGFPQPKALPLEIEKILKSAKKGNVLFSFGTQVPSQHFPPQLIRNFIAAFKRFPEFNFIWKFGGKTALNATNVFNLEWLPQTDLLFDSRVVAFISHMGLNSFVESSMAGVPLICVPLMVDQFHNARQAIRLETGVGLEKTDMGEEKIVEALEKVLRDQRYKRTAESLRGKLRDNPEKSERTLLESIEFAAKYPDLHSHFALSSTHFSWMAAHGYDVVVFLTLSLFTLLFVVVFLSFSLLPKLLKARKMKNE